MANDICIHLALIVYMCQNMSYIYIRCEQYQLLTVKTVNEQYRDLFLQKIPAVTWLEYCRYGVKYKTINQSINQSNSFWSENL